jgi:hypothetical protein
MKFFFQLFVLSIFITSCKQGASKININDVEAHRDYQDSLLKPLLKSNEGYKEKLRLLINEYKSIESNQKKENANLDYYIARLYSKVFDNPMYYMIIDSTNYDIIDSVTYKNYKDSARLYRKKSIDKDPNNVKSFYLNANGLYWEWMTYLNNPKAPFLANQSLDEWTKEVRYILNNALRISEMDTSKYRGQEIIEISYFSIVVGILNLNSEGKFDINNVINQSKNNLKSIVLLEQFSSILDKSDELILLNQKVYVRAKSSVLSAISLAKNKLEEITKKEIEDTELAKTMEAYNNIDLKHKYTYVNNDAGVRGLLDLYTSKNYTQVVTSTSGLLHGRGNYSHIGNTISFHSTSGISISGDATLEYINKKIIIILSTGARYMQND